MCLQVVHLVPTLEGPIVNLLVDQALEMDVQIKINDKGGVFLEDEVMEEDGDWNASLKKRSYHIISHETVSAGKSDNSHSNNDVAVEDMDEISEIAERLDSLMDILCQRIQKLTTFSADSVSEALAAVVNARRLYRHLDEIFDKKVRTTHRSKFVPFVFFVLFGREHDALEAVGRLTADRKATTDSDTNAETLNAERGTEVNDIVAASINQTDFLYRGFCAKLIDLFYNPVDPGELPSQTVVCCLASFVSRATYVCPETVCETVAAILQWAEAYIEAHTESQGTPSLIRRQSSGLGNTRNQRDIHALFYTACQSAFYIMCFRGAEALHYYLAAWRHRDDPESQYASPESVNLGAKRWKAICKHPLQPLKYCLESVRVEFLHVAEDLNLFSEDTTGNDSGSKDAETKSFIEQLWNANDQGKSNGVKSKMITPKRKRSSIISTAATLEKKRLDGGVGGLGKGSNPLDSYFPFDPYLLQSSYEHVHPYYRNWEDCILSMEELDDATTAETDVVNEAELVKGGSNETGDAEEHDDLTDSGDENDDDDEEEDDGEEEEESDDDQSKSSTIPSETNALKPADKGIGLEVEIRRCRAMSTGSQASW
jgi:RNA polymerase I-specific transcription initiation factor RRN3